MENGSGGAAPRRLRHSWEARCRLVGLMLGGLSPAVAAERCGMSRATGYRLRQRYAEGGWAALRDRPPVPRRQPRRLDAELEAEVLALRARTSSGPLVLGAILGLPASTVGKVLRRAGRSRLPRPLRDPAVRYERDRPGELVHVDSKRLGRFHTVGKRILRDGVHRSRRVGWQHLHVAIDDHSRLLYAEIRPTAEATDCAAFLRRAAAWYATHDVHVERVMTDNAKAYHGHTWRDLCAELGIERRFTRPYTPRTNGKAEAVIKTLLREWAYRHAYPSSAHRAAALDSWVRWYNRRRPHGSLHGQTPLSRVSQLRGQYT